MNTGQSFLFCSSRDGVRETERFNVSLAEKPQNCINHFFPRPYRFTQLPENTSAETRFFTYTAEDQDEDADLRYSLLQEQVIGEDEMKRPVQDKDYLMVRDKQSL